MIYFGSVISDNIAKTPEGFLVCKNVSIGRAGKLEYTGEEIGLPDTDGIYTVYRKPEENKKPETLASFEGKPLTDGHPSVDVDPTNYHFYAKGHIQNIRCNNDGTIIADLFITDESLIDDVLSNKKREVSCGYDVSYTQDNSGMIFQTDIRGNHLAIVESGRAGKNIKIRDSKNKKIGGTMPPKDLSQVLDDFDKKVKNVKTLDELNNVLKETTEEIEGSANDEGENLEPLGNTNVKPNIKDSDPNIAALSAAVEALTKKVDTLLQGQSNDATPEGDLDKAINELQSNNLPPSEMSNSPQEPPPTDPEVMEQQKSTDSEIIEENEDVASSNNNADNVELQSSSQDEDLSENYDLEESNKQSQVIPSNDSAIKVLKATRDSLRFIKNPEERRNVVDSVLKQVQLLKRNNNSIKNIVKNKAADANGQGLIKKIQSNYDKLNPHKSKK